MKWLPINTRPKHEGQAYLVRLPGNDMCDSLALQVSNFEGQMYPDHLDGSIDWGDRIVGATHWTALPKDGPYEAN